MGLRRKVALVLAGAIIPISLVFGMWRITAERRIGMERRVERFATAIQQRGTGDCRDLPPRRRRGRPPRGPGGPGGPGGHFKPYLYSNTFVPHDGAPPFPAVLREVRDTDEPQHYWAWNGEQLGATAVKLADEGDCAIALIPWQESDAPPGAARSVLAQTVALAAILAVLGGLVAMPIVRRIRRLELAVRNARHGEFTLDLGGDDEINALADAFAETLEAVGAREKALEEYIANTTHDLAIPLTVLQHRLRKLSKVDDNEDVRIALEESHYIAALIANMRTAAKLDGTEVLDLEHDIDLCELVVRVAQRHLPIAEQKGIELNWATPETPVIARGEPTLVEQAISNLVQNAVQYNNPGGHVSILLEVVSDGFELVVADDGPGVPDTMREAILERGVRDDEARSRNGEGQGFGLAIVRRVISLHNWSMELDHDEGLAVHLRG